MRVNEIYKAIQGEGKFIGVPSIFVRFSRCNLSCNWCDTSYTWLFSKSKLEEVWDQPFMTQDIQLELQFYNPLIEETDLSASSIYAEIGRLLMRTNITNIVFTGGEPLLQDHKQLEQLMKNILSKHNFFTFEIETNGTIEPSKELIELADSGKLHFNVSPKTENSGNTYGSRFKSDVLKKFADTNSIFKFVVTEERDITEIRVTIMKCDLNKDGKVYLMPEGKTKEEQMRTSDEVIRLCEEFGYRYAPRLHVLLWGNQRGI